jgi:hypothetical protein
MLYDAVDDAGDQTPDALRRAYAEELAAVVADLGVDHVVAETSLDRQTVERIESGAEPSLTLEEAAEVLSLLDGAPSADDIAWEARDHLLMGMTTGVLDVDTVATEIDSDLEGKEVQQVIEGRLPMTLTQYAKLQAFIASRQR